MAKIHILFETPSVKSAPLHTPTLPGRMCKRRLQGMLSALENNVAALK